MQANLIQSFSEIGNLPRAIQINTEPGELRALLKKHKLSDAEFGEVLKIVGRRPTLAELGVFSAMWSEHCSYKSSKIHLKKLPTEGRHVVVGPGENAGVVRISGKLCVAFKMESHNHPSYIEPYQGAATGVGGILRDVFCMGARPIVNLNSLRFGEKQHPKAHFLFENVVKGIGDYGNCVGIPTVGGSVSFDKSYNGNILVNAMTVGVIHEDRIFKGYATGINNLVVYVGSATGRDGIHGASMASDSFSSEQSGERSTIQVGDPFAEKLLLEATLEALEKGLVVGLQDMGAAGLTSSSFEMADRAGNGLYMDLDRVPTRAAHMSAYELLLSESQERMLMCVEPSKWEQLKEVLSRWDLDFAVIGIVTDTGRVQIVKGGVLEVDLLVAPLAESAPRYNRPYQYPLPKTGDNLEFRQSLSHLDLNHVLKTLLHHDGDKGKIYRQYDHHIGNKTVLGPEAQGAGILWIQSEWAETESKYLGLAVATACNERYCAEDPHDGAAHAVLKCYRTISATGAEPLAITDCLNYGNPEDPIVMGQIVAGIDGISVACRELEVPVVSGNVSLYNETDKKSISPTPMIGMVGRHLDVRQAVPGVIEKLGKLLILGSNDLKYYLGGSLIGNYFADKPVNESIPNIHWDAERQASQCLRQLINEGLVFASRDVGTGGILCTLSKMLFGANEKLGCNVEWARGLSNTDRMIKYFGELSATYIIQVGDEDAVLSICKNYSQIRLFDLGQVVAGEAFLIDGIQLSSVELRASYKSALVF